MDELLVEANRRGAAVALLQKPYVGGLGSIKCRRGVRVFQSIGDGTVKAAIAVFNPDLNVRMYPEYTTKNIVAIGIQTVAWEITLFSFYFEPNTPIKPYLEIIKKIKRDSKSKMWLMGEMLMPKVHGGG